MANSVLSVTVTGVSAALWSGDLISMFPKAPVSESGKLKSTAHDPQGQFLTMVFPVLALPHRWSTRGSAHQQQMTVDVPLAPRDPKVNCKNEKFKNDRPKSKHACALCMFFCSFRTNVYQDLYITQSSADPKN